MTLIWRFKYLIIKLIAIVTLFILSANVAQAQRVAVSTDLLKWGLCSPNVNVDVIVSPKYSINIETSFNPFDSYISSMSLKHVSFSPEVRRWFKRPLYSHYVGINALIAVHDIVLFDNRYRGNTMAVGVGYGYSMLLGKHWNLTPSIGVGYGVTTLLSDPENSVNSTRYKKLTPMVTRIALSFTYIIN